MPRNLAWRDILLPVVRRYIYIAFGVIWAAFFRFPSLFLFVDPPLEGPAAAVSVRSVFPRRVVFQSATPADNNTQHGPS